MTTPEKVYYTILAALFIFILGIQIGIRHGKELTIQERCEYDFILSN